MLIKSALIELDAFDSSQT